MSLDSRMNFPDDSAEAGGGFFADIFKEKFSFWQKSVANCSFSRVEVSFPCQFAVISEKEFNSLYSAYMATPTRGRASPVPEVPKASPKEDSGKMAGAIMERLDRIEEKLDRLLGAPLIDARQAVRIPARPSMEMGHVRDLSGGGILLGSPGVFGQGDFLNIMINSRDLYPMYIEALGRVVRLLPPLVDSLNESACEFAGIHEEDREEVSSFVRRQQRELARVRQID